MLAIYFETIEDDPDGNEFARAGDRHLGVAGSDGNLGKHLAHRLTHSGAQGRKLYERFFKNLFLEHIQLDELWANVKQSERDVWVWTVCETKTKIIPVIQLGTRTQEMAYYVVHELKTRLKAGIVPCAGCFVHSLGFVEKNCIIFICMKKKCEDVFSTNLGLYRSNMSSGIAGSLKDAQ